MSTENRRVELPRDIGDLDHLQRLKGILRLPPEIEARLPLHPDHIREAEEECAREFLEIALLPTIQDGIEVHDKMLRALAENFKQSERLLHPKDIRENFDLLFTAQHIAFMYHSFFRSNGYNSTESQLIERSYNILSDYFARQ